ncbi:MAG: hypothetical protein MMC33_006587 [Icmadophila ericetorum]|nr:hypothetical protein [Icmadophila ericetorum]
MTSPTRPLRRSPPRRALHERSESHANEVTNPTLRIVGDEDARIYASSPFPTLPSQILLPDSRKRQSVFEVSGSVSGEENPTEHLSAQEQDPRLPQIIRAHKGKEIYTSKYNGFDERSPQPHYSGSLSTPPLASSSTSNLLPSQMHSTQVADLNFIKLRSGVSMEQGIEEERISDEIIQLPSVWGSRDSRDEAYDSPLSSPSHNDGLIQQGMTNKSSEQSLSSTGSNETVIKSKVHGPPPRGSYTYSAFPNTRPTSSRSTRSFSNPLRAILDPNRYSLTPVSSSSPTSPVSPLSPVAPDFPAVDHYHADLRNFSLPTSSRPGTNSDEDVPNIQFPVVRPPAVSGSWAQSSTNVGKRSSRNYPNEEDQMSKWTPHLSTVPSVNSGDRNSGPMASELPSNTSSMAIDRSSLSSYYPPMPTFSRQRDVTGSTIRVVGEDDDIATDLPTSPNPNRRSDFTILSADSRRDSTITTGPGSRGSFLRDSIPAWARAYYASDARNAFLASSTSLADDRPATQQSQRSIGFPLGLFRSRSRREDQGRQPSTQRSPTRQPLNPQGESRQITSSQGNRDSLEITPVTPDGIVQHEVEVRGVPRKKTSQVWSPHLWHDRRQADKRRTIFREPSLDEEAEGKAISRRNLQVWLFALGFLAPLAWIVASFLPLPPKPSFSPPHTPTTPNITQDIEKALGPLDLARYENARWWRVVNRILAVIGILIIAAIVGYHQQQLPESRLTVTQIVLAVVGTKR